MKNNCWFNIILTALLLSPLAALYAADVLKPNILINHVGYLSQESKRCIVTSTTTSTFDLINESSQSVFSGSLIFANSDLGTYKTGDFSSFTQSGSYRVKVGSTYSRLFSIGSSVVTQYQDFLQMIGVTLRNNHGKSGTLDFALNLGCS